jgi:hypothetical protein
MSSKSYTSKSSWHPANHQTKTNPQINSSFAVQTKTDNDSESALESAEYKGLPSNAIINNIQTSLNSGNYPTPSAPIQPKLTIGAPGDQYEQEADQVASQVVQKMNAPATPDDDHHNSIQRKLNISSLQRAEETEENLQGKFNFQSPNIQADFESTLNSARGGGSPLDHAFRAKIEPQMSADFSGVRVHTDATANNLSHSIQAKAFTTGNHIFMKEGEYNPSSKSGQELLAHELTHVVQQNGSAIQTKKDTNSCGVGCQCSSCVSTTASNLLSPKLMDTIQSNQTKPFKQKPKEEGDSCKHKPKEEGDSCKHHLKEEKTLTKTKGKELIQREGEDIPGWDDEYEEYMRQRREQEVETENWLSQGLPTGTPYKAGQTVMPSFVLDKPAPKRSNKDASTTQAGPKMGFPPTFTGHVAIDFPNKVWRYQLDTVESKGKIQIVYYSPDHYPAPTPTDDSGALTNVTQTNWKKIVKDLDKNKTGVADKWSAYRAEDVHENYHWVNEWQDIMTKELRKAEVQISALSVGFDKAPTQSDAEADIKPKATQIFNDAMKEAHKIWMTYGDSPGDPPYLTQPAVIEPLIERVKTHAAGQGWT